MTAAGTETRSERGFDGSRATFESLVGLLEGDEAGGLSHAELEDRLEVEGRELLRQLFQDHLDLRADREQRAGRERVIDADGVARETVEDGRCRGLASVFGALRVRRLAYRARGACDLHPADAMLSLPVERHSHGLRRLAAVESGRGSFDDAVQAIERATGQRLGKRQVEDLAGRAAIDFDAFYARREVAVADRGDALVLSCDGKGVVMRPGALRPATARAAANAHCKLKTRLSKGEKRNRKRMAEVGAVYDCAPVARTATDVMPADDAQRAAATAGPIAENKWLTASVTRDAADTIGDVFDEAERRDGGHQRDWVALVDGNNHQIARIQAEARSRGTPITIVIDFVHVIEYLWKAAWCFHQEGDPAAEDWVHRHAQAVLHGRASTVAGNIAAPPPRPAWTARAEPVPTSAPST